MDKLPKYIINPITYNFKSFYLFIFIYVFFSYDIWPTSREESFRVSDQKYSNRQLQKRAWLLEHWSSMNQRRRSTCKFMQFNQHLKCSPTKQCAFAVRTWLKRVFSWSEAFGISLACPFAVHVLVAIQYLSRFVHQIRICFGFDITSTRLFKYIENFTTKKWKKFQIKHSNIFHISAQNIDCGYSLEPPRRGCSNEYPQSMFWAEIWKIMYTPVNPSFTT